jgi:hypothetical protein
MNFRACLFALLLVFVSTQSYPCTIFSVVRDGEVFVGNNEDERREYTAKSWFIQPRDGKYGCVLFGWADGWAQGGMNDQGLFWDWVAGYKTDWEPSPEKRDHLESLSYKIIRECATVKEAVETCRLYNQPSFAYARVMFVDRNGDSAIVGWEKDRIKVIRSQGGLQILGYGHRTGKARLDDLQEVSIAAAKGIATACCRRKGKVVTHYSSVCNLRNGDIYVFNIWRHHKGLFSRVTQSRSDRKCFRFNLDEELKKGNHFYDLSQLASQLTKPPQTDGRTLKAANVDQAVYLKYVGQYFKDSGERITITKEGSKLFIESSEWPTAKYELFPVSETEFFLSFIDFRVQFVTDMEDRVVEILFLSKERDGTSTSERAKSMSE